MINSFIYQLFIYCLFIAFFILNFYSPAYVKPKKDDKKIIFAWSLYDFANQPFTTLVVTFIYGAFFTKIIVADEILGTSLWSRAITISSIPSNLFNNVLKFKFSGLTPSRGEIKPPNT